MSIQTDSVAGDGAETSGWPMRETVVFAFDNDEQRAQLFDLIRPYNSIKDDGLRVVALSADNEVNRVFLIEQAVERCHLNGDLEDTVVELCECANLSKWKWPGDRTDEDAAKDSA
jgi:hypothetical protein